MTKQGFLVSKAGFTYPIATICSNTKKKYTHPKQPINQSIKQTDKKRKREKVKKTGWRGLSQYNAKSCVQNKPFTTNHCQIYGLMTICNNQFNQRRSYNCNTSKELLLLYINYFRSFRGSGRWLSYLSKLMRDTYFSQILFNLTQALQWWHTSGKLHHHGMGVYAHYTNMRLKIVLN